MNIEAFIEECENSGYNAGLKQAQWQITKAMLALGDDLPPKTKRLLRFIYDEIEKEMKGNER